MPHPKSITLKQLRALAAIVETGSITAAAGTLHVTPPAVSTQLKSLEEGVSAQVLHRGPDGKVIEPVSTMAARARSCFSVIDLGCGMRLICLLVREI